MPGAARGAQALERVRAGAEQLRGFSGRQELRLGGCGRSLIAEAVAEALAELRAAPSAVASASAPFLTTKQAGELLGMSPKSLEALRARGAGLRIGRLARYNRDDLHRFVASGAVGACTRREPGGRRHACALTDLRSREAITLQSALPSPVMIGMKTVNAPSPATVPFAVEQLRDHSHALRAGAADRGEGELAGAFDFLLDTVLDEAEAESQRAVGAEEQHEAVA